MYTLLTGPFVYVVSRSYGRQTSVWLECILPTWCAPPAHLLPGTRIISTYYDADCILSRQVRINFARWLKVPHISNRVIKFLAYPTGETSLWRFINMLKRNKKHMDTQSSCNLLEKLDVEYYCVQATEDQIYNEFPFAGGLKYKFVPWYAHHSGNDLINMDTLFHNFLENKVIEIKIVKDDI